MVLHRPSAAQNLLSTTRWRSVFTIKDCLFSSLNQIGPMMPCFEMATHVVYEGPSVWKQPPDNRWLENSNYNQEGIWNTFWRECKSRTIWATDWKLCGMILHKLKLMCTKYEVIYWKHVEVICIFCGWHFWGVTLYYIYSYRFTPCYLWALTGTGAL